MMSGTQRRTWVVAACTALASGAGSMANLAQAAEPVPVAAAADEAKQIADLEYALTVVNDIPDETLAEGEQAVAEHLRAKGMDTAAKPRTAAVQLGWWDTTKCVAAITAAIAGAAIPVAKILKIKSLIKAAGGVKETASKAIKVYKKVKDGEKMSTAAKEVFSSLGATVAGLAAEVLGIDAIQSNC